MLAKSFIWISAVLIGLAGLYFSGCGDSPKGDSSVSPQIVTFPGPDNPWQQDTEISFIMPQDGPWSATILDVEADTVRNYQGTAQKEDSVLIVWDGNDDFAVPRPNGVYFAKISVGEYQSTKKLLLVRMP